MAEFVFQELGTGRKQVIHTRSESDAWYMLTEEQESEGDNLADRLMYAKHRWKLRESES